MKLRTILDDPAFDFQLDYSSGVITLGSCFSEVVGNYLQQHKFPVKSNPFGTVYNMKSVLDVIRNAVDDTLPEERRIVSREGLFFHLDYHSQFYSDSPQGLTGHIRSAGHDFRQFLSGARLLIITLGTSWVYAFEGDTVSNCHKLPASHFEKRFLGLDEQRELLSLLISTVRRLNPHLKIMFTVSPVRHIKDGLTENGASKAVLRVICQEAVQNYPGTCYFPSYEVMMDDLRDYRFYRADLIHPNEVAENHICTLFMKSVVSEEARKISEEWGRVRQAMEHRPLNPGSASHRAFLLNLREKIKTFGPYFEVREEAEEVEERLKAFG